MPFPMKRYLLVISLFLITSTLPVSCRSKSYECTDPLGCLEIPEGYPVVIGTLLATNGEQRPAGIEALQSVEKAIEDKSELLGHSIQLVQYGTDCTADSARSGATEFSNNNQISAVIGPTCTSEVAVADSILSNAGIPLLGPAENAATATTLIGQLFTALEQVAVQMPDHTLYIPRQALLIALHLNP
jgi:branched-chain amino acid transport system substrate-binding protein